MSEVMKAKYARQFGTENYENAYCEDAKCSNCGDTDYFWICKGLLKPKKPFRCTRCGCNTMKVL